MSAFGLGRGRPVAAGSTPSKLISAKSSASTNTSITRTGLLSSMKSSRHSGNSVHCPRSASSTKRLINSPTESRENHNSSTAFSHSQGQTRTLRLSGRMSVLPPRTDIERPLRHVRFVPGRDSCTAAKTDVSSSCHKVRPYQLKKAVIGNTDLYSYSLQKTQIAPARYPRFSCRLSLDASENEHSDLRSIDQSPPLQYP